MDTLAKLNPYMKGRRGLMPAALFLAAISSIAGIVPYLLIWFIIRELFTNGSYYSPGLILIFAWWSVGAAIASIVLYFIALSFSHLTAFRVEVNLRKEAMRRVIEMPLGFFNQNTTGRIRKIIDDNAGVTHVFLAHQMPDLAATLMIPITIVTLIFVFDWRLGLACLAPIIMSLFIMGFMMGKKGKYFMERYMTYLEDMNSEAVEYVRGIPVVKVFQQTVFSFKHFHKSITDYKTMVSNYAKMWEKPMSAYTVIINSFVFVLVPVVIIIINHTGNVEATILNLFLYILITPTLAQSIMRSMHLNQAVGQAREAINRIENLVDAEGLVVSKTPKPIERYGIQLDHVTFSYPESNQKAVEDISFDIAEGETVALVGGSGSGKTTIARLIPRFWDVDQGAVMIGGVNVKDISPDELMQHVSFVFQNNRLFKTSLLENITYGNPLARMEAVEKAVEMAQCKEIIDRLPDGYQTMIGSQGTYLSGGEQQRIIIARAMLKDAPIVILDEATAFADPENEYLIQQAFRKLTEGKTVLMIAHRLNSVISADKILVMKEGKIVEQGNHQTLLKKENVYSTMWEEYQKAVDWKIGKEKPL
ncbi:ABC transporter ATP-binding protein [Tindallia californiensis]|uniref:ATP-binding cassette, subfamily B n=1 Tax=Tindallia californiensis TaxID=159292 RepID=A0A1H3QD22_9FIRM|nr:ABC transporter ATP-binding protein [Tindallia californiensis]SDZ11432.1 ATP-binding cassette, subfamily B [Tindallia californiensis]